MIKILFEELLNKPAKSILGRYLRVRDNTKITHRFFAQMLQE